MEVEQAILTRRSIRKYTDEDVTDEQIDKILQAAYWAPRVNERWVFIVVRDKNVHDILSKPAPDRVQEHIANAKVNIVVCIDLREAGPRDRELYAMQEASGAIENMLLTIHDLGLGACWNADFDEEKVKEALNIPDGVKVIAIISIGHPAEQGKGIRRKKLEEVVHWEKYGNHSRP
mgnify:FL=1